MNHRGFVVQARLRGTVFPRTNVGDCVVYFLEIPAKWLKLSIQDLEETRSSLSGGLLNLAGRLTRAPQVRFNVGSAKGLVCNGWWLVEK